MTGGAPRVILEAPGEAAMESVIKGLHHVTATVDDAQRDLDFCLGALGLRLVKQTVNFDNKTVYHFYYGDERGTPGTIWTTFPYRGKGVPVGRKGAGQIGVTSFSVPAGSLGFWKERLGRAGGPGGAEGRGTDRRHLVLGAGGLAGVLERAARTARRPGAGGGIAVWRRLARLRRSVGPRDRAGGNRPRPPVPVDRRGGRGGGGPPRGLRRHDGGRPPGEDARADDRAPRLRPGKRNGGAAPPGGERRRARQDDRHRVGGGRAGRDERPRHGAPRRHGRVE